MLYQNTQQVSTVAHVVRSSSKAHTSGVCAIRKAEGLVEELKHLELRCKGKRRYEMGRRCGCPWKSIISIGSTHVAESKRSRARGETESIRLRVFILFPGPHSIMAL